MSVLEKQRYKSDLSLAQLDMELQRYGLALTKVTNNQLNTGKRPVSCLAEIIEFNYGQRASVRYFKLLSKLWRSLVWFRALGLNWDTEFHRLNAVLREVDETVNNG
jgi:hypothetical protein